jgi:hypothetical protein
MHHRALELVDQDGAEQTLTVKQASPNLGRLASPGKMIETSANG